MSGDGGLLSVWVTWFWNDNMGLVTVPKSCYWNFRKGTIYAKKTLEQTEKRSNDWSRTATSKQVEKTAEACRFEWNGTIRNWRLDRRSKKERVRTKRGLPKRKGSRWEIQIGEVVKFNDSLMNLDGLRTVPYTWSLQTAKTTLCKSVALTGIGGSNPSFPT